MATSGQGHIERQFVPIVAARMRRREFVALLGVAAVPWPLVARAQSVRKTYRIGTLTVSPFELASHFIKAFEESIAELGYVSGSSILYEHRFAGGATRADYGPSKSTFGAGPAPPFSPQQRP